MWGNTYKSTLDSLFLIQKRIVRIVAKVDFLEHTKPLIFNLGILNIFDIVKLNSGIIMYKAHKNILPINVQKYFKLNQQIHSHYTRQWESFKTNYRRTKFTLLSFCVNMQTHELYEMLC